MTKRSAIAVALGLVAALLIASVALSTNFGIGSAPATSVAKESGAGKEGKHQKKADKPIVKTRRVTLHRERPPKVIGGGSVSVMSAAPSGNGGSSTAASASRGGSSGSPAAHQASGSSSGGGEFENENESEDRESDDGDD